MLTFGKMQATILLLLITTTTTTLTITSSSASSGTQREAQTKQDGSRAVQQDRLGKILSELITATQWTTSGSNHNIANTTNTDYNNPYHRAEDYHQPEGRPTIDGYELSNEENIHSVGRSEEDIPFESQSHRRRRRRRRRRRSPAVSAAAVSAALLMPINEMRISGSKNEPPSRPTKDWSQQRPYFGPDMQRNVSVELGKTAYLTCKVYELGDKTVSWLKLREAEILTTGRYTYISDPRFTPINDAGSHDWILEIKDVGLNDSTSYECQVSTDPKMSTIINLQVKAAKARIKQGEQFYASVGYNIEFTCEINQRHSIVQAQSASSSSSPIQQTYWYFNGNLLNYAKTHSQIDKNFSIEWDPISQTSRFKLFTIQQSDAGNYTCKPTSAEPATIRLHVKKPIKGNSRDRSHYNGYNHANNKNDAQYRHRNANHYGFADSSTGLELMDSSSAASSSLSQMNFYNIIISLIAFALINYLMNINHIVASRVSGSTIVGHRG